MAEVDFEVEALGQEEAAFEVQTSVEVSVEEAFAEPERDLAAVRADLHPGAEVLRVFVTRGQRAAVSREAPRRVSAASGEVHAIRMLTEISEREAPVRPEAPTLIPEM